MSPERVKFEESRPNVISNGSCVRIIVRTHNRTVKTARSRGSTRPFGIQHAVFHMTERNPPAKRPKKGQRSQGTITLDQGWTHRPSCFNPSVQPAIGI